MKQPLYEKHDLLDKFASILGECYPNELMSAHEIALGLKQKYPRTFETLDKPVGGAGQTQDTLTRYIARLLYPAQNSPAEVKRRFVTYIFGRKSVSSVKFADGTIQSMNPAYGLALFALQRQE